MNWWLEPRPKLVKFLLKGSAYGCASLIGLTILLIAGSWVWMKWAQRLPTAESLRQQFENHRAAYLLAAERFKQEQIAAIKDSRGYPAFVERDGEVDDEAQEVSNVPAFGALVRATGAKHLEMDENGIQRYVLSGYDSDLFSSTSNAGILFDPDLKQPQFVENLWTVTSVGNLGDKSLPHTKGSVATGFYVVLIEPGWFAYRFDYRP